MKQEEKDSTTGMVTSRECPLCGHHEIGFVTQGGKFHPLRPGTFIQVVEPPAQVEPIRDELKPSTSTQKEAPLAHRLWIPEPLRGDKALRLKYGVMVNAPLSKGGISGGLYELAYLAKLERLIEKVLDVPLPVILDRFFSAPHLASGNARQIAEVMYHELEEIRRPVQLMQNWLERKGDRNLAELIAPKDLETLAQEPADDAQVEKELEGLTLEEFLGML